MRMMSHSQQPQAASDWHLLQQSMALFALTVGPVPPMMTFSRKAEALQHPGTSESSLLKTRDCGGSVGGGVGAGEGPPVQVRRRAISTLNCGEVKASESLEYTAGVVAPLIGVSQPPVHSVRLTSLPNVTPAETFTV
eukprot:SAG11_NODE_8003_length_1071_cov_1.299383_1_plen_137_part_00